MYGSFNLTRALSGLERSDAKFGALVRAIRNVDSGRSRQIDLEEAKEAIDVAKQHGESEIDNDAALPKSFWVIAEALFVHALLLYCKAAHSDSKERGRVDVLGHIPKERRADHQYITRLRDTVYAHYGTGDRNQPDPWLNEFTVMHLQPEGAHLSHPSMRSATKAEAYRKLSYLVDTALAYMNSYVTEWGEVLFEEFEKYKDDPFILAALPLHRFDENEFFGRPAESRQKAFSVPPGTAVIKRR